MGPIERDLSLKNCTKTTTERDISKANIMFVVLIALSNHWPLLSCTRSLGTMWGPCGSGGAKQGVADHFALRLLLLFDQLREVAATRRSDLPDDDPVSTLELIIFFLGSVQTQIQHMQLILLECS